MSRIRCYQLEHLPARIPARLNMLMPDPYQEFRRRRLQGPLVTLTEIATLAVLGSALTPKQDGSFVRYLRKYASERSKASCDETVRAALLRAEDATRYAMERFLFALFARVIDEHIEWIGKFDGASKPQIISPIDLADERGWICCLVSNAIVPPDEATLSPSAFLGCHSAAPSSGYYGLHMKRIQAQSFVDAFCDTNNFEDQLFPEPRVIVSVAGRRLADIPQVANVANAPSSPLRVPAVAAAASSEPNEPPSAGLSSTPGAVPLEQGQSRRGRGRGNGPYVEHDRLIVAEIEKGIATGLYTGWWDGALALHAKIKGAPANRVKRITERATEWARPKE